MKIRIFAIGAFVCLPGLFAASAQTSAVPWWTTNTGYAAGASTLNRVRGIAGPAFVGRFVGMNSTVETGFLADTLLRGTIVSVAAAPGGPWNYVLEQNYPNPFNPTTIIRYSIPGRSHVALNVYNTLGQHVAALVDREEQPGVHEVTFDGSNVAGGIYFYRLQTDGYIQTRKLVLMR